MHELEFKYFVGLSWRFGGGSKSYFTGTAGVGVSQRFGGVEPGANIALNFYNGGMGARSDSKMMNVDAVLSGKVTAGWGQTNPMSIYPLHMESGTGLEDNYKYSATLGTSMILNNSGRNQQVGFLQLRATDFAFQFYNDFGGFKKIGIADGYDRWWTGGGKFVLGNNNSSYQMIAASDVFTAETDSDSEFDEATAEQSLKDFKSTNSGGFFNRAKNRLSNYTPAEASEVDQSFLDEFRGGAKWNSNAHSFDLNTGRTSFKLKTPQGSFGVNGLGADHMYSQDGIHRLINFHLIPSERPNYWEVQFGPQINTGF